MSYIKFDNVNYWYEARQPFKGQALKNVSFEIKKGAFVCLAGHTGSGKSTLLQHFNGLKKPMQGQVTLPGGTLDAKSRKNAKEIKNIRQKVGLVFQFPEYQLFEETVLKDVMFGPRNYRVPFDEAENKARKALALVGLGEELFERSPFELSGGQMRRVAIAGILAMDPEVLVLDEPTAGLDPRGQQEILELLEQLKQQGKTIVMATHNMDVVAQYADQVLVLEKGHLMLDDHPAEAFKGVDKLRGVGIDLPTAAKVFKEVYPVAEDLPLTLDDFVSKVKRYRNGN